MLLCRNMHCLCKFVATVMGRSIKIEEGYACCIDYPCQPEGTMISFPLRSYSAEQDAEADAHIPCCEQGGVGRAALGGRGEVDEHILHGRKHMAVAEADDEGCTIVAEACGQGGKEQISEDGDSHAYGAVPQDAAPPQGAYANETAGH